MRAIKRVLMVSVVGATLAGCASSPNDELFDRIAEMEERQRDLMAEKAEIEQDKREKELSVTPNWYLEPPQSDATGIYGVGMSSSKSLSHGIGIARLKAEFQIAKMLKQEVSGSERSYEQGDADGNLNSQTTFLIDKIVDSVPVVGYDVIEQVNEPIGGVHQSYILLKMPYEQFNKVLQSERNKTLDKQVQQSFDDLERRLDRRRAQRQQEAQLKFDREQQALSNRAELINDAGPQATSTSK